MLGEFKSILLEPRNKFVPVTTVKDKGKVPSMNYNARKWVKKKHKVIKQGITATHLSKWCLK